MLAWNGCKSHACCKREQAGATDFGCFGFSLPFLSFLELTGLQN